MCGICAILCDFGKKNDEQSKEVINQEMECVKENINQRGPDSQESYIDSELSIGLYSSVLHIRGEKTVKQPIFDEEQNILLWNGEAYGGIDIKADENDTEKVLHYLSCKNQEDILTRMERIQGEWAFIYIDRREKKLYFGRDPCGRRSLLMKITPQTIHSSTYYYITLSSVGYMMENSSVLLTDEMMDTSIFDMSIIDPTPTPYFIHYLNQWIELPPYGIYSVNLQDYQVNHHLYIQLDRWKHSYSRQLKETDLQSISELYTFPQFPDYLYETANQLNDALMESIKKRVLYSSLNDNMISVLFSGGIDCTLLTAIASSILPEEYVIELINISFDNPYYNSPDRRTALNSYIDLKQQFPNREFRFVCVDISLNEFFKYERHIMTLIYPKDSTMDVHIAAAFYFASRGIGKRIDAQNMDIDTLKGAVDYENNLKNIDNPEVIQEPGYISLLVPYTCKSKVILSGTGADELFGGYTRHYGVFVKEGWKALDEVLQMEYNRLWIRNLGRDDRAISDNGKEIRFPFLDENVVQFTYNQPIYKLIDPRLVKGEGDKIILRVLCPRYNLYSCTHLSKRAIQFGSRIVKQLNIFEGKNSKQTKGHMKHVIHDRKDTN